MELQTNPYTCTYLERVIRVLDGEVMILTGNTFTMKGLDVDIWPSRCVKFRSNLADRVTLGLVVLGSALRTIWQIPFTLVLGPKPGAIHNDCGWKLKMSGSAGISCHL